MSILRPSQSMSIFRVTALPENILTVKPIGRLHLHRNTATCCQPLSEALTVAAFHTGLKEKLPELKELLEQDTVIYSHGFSAAELQKLLSKRRKPAFADAAAVEKQLIRILDLAADGLRKRGRGEEAMLAPLYRRAAMHTNPAKTMLDGIENGTPVAEFIRQYAAI